MPKPEKRKPVGKPKRGVASLSSGYWRGAHSVHRLRYHLVWIPKYRKRVLEGDIARRLEVLFLQACEVNGWQLHELSIQPDHVHLLLQIPADKSVSSVVRLLKGGTSRVLRLEFPELEEFLWGKHFWCEGYFAASVGQMEESIVRRYIQNQDKEMNKEMNKDSDKAGD